MENKVVELMKVLIKTRLNLVKILKCGSNTKKVMGITKIDRPVSSFCKDTESSSLYSNEIAYAMNKEEFISNPFHLTSLFSYKKTEAMKNKITGRPFIVFGIIGKIAKIKIETFKIFSLLIFLMIF